jgi:ureidoglycolate lyase
VKTITLSKLTQETFSGFGRVIDTTDPEGHGFSVNEGRAERFNYPQLFNHDDGMGDPNLAIYKITPSNLPVTIERLERHPNSSQIFLPIVSGHYLICVAPPDLRGLPDVSMIMAFIVPPEIGISYHPQTWHLPLMVLENPGTFAMMMWNDGTNNDCVLHNLEKPIRILQNEQ